MEITQEGAGKVLGEVARTQVTTRRALRRVGAAILMIWGLVWFVLNSGIRPYLGSLFLPSPTWVVVIHRFPLAMNLVGLVTTIWVVARERSHVRGRYDVRIVWFWFLLIALRQVNTWVVFLFHGADAGATAVILASCYWHTLVTFGLAVTGLFFWRPLLWIGLIATGLAVAGVILFSSHLSAWMAFVYLGAVFAPGLWLWMKRSQVAQDG